MLAKAKEKAIDLGLYAPARWLIDHVADRSRLNAHNVRVALLRSLIAPGDLCFDVGANIGDYTASLLAAGARVVSVEPQPNALKELSARFGGNANVTIEPVGLGAKEGTAPFFVRTHHGASSFLEDWHGGYLEKIDIPVRTLESLIQRLGVPSYVKMDVEGYELQVIMGLESRVSLMSFEYHLTGEDCASKLEIIKRLSRFGPVSLNLIEEKSSDFYWPNFVSFETFTTVFPDKLKAAGRSFYGDMFIKTASSMEMKWTEKR